MDAANNSVPKYFLISHILKIQLIHSEYLLKNILKTSLFVGRNKLYDEEREEGEGRG
jgi:hypothetical protein